MLPELGLDGLGLVATSYRAGGATHYFREVGELRKLQWRGRWNAEQNIDHYIQEFAAINILTKVSAENRVRLKKIETFAVSLLVEES